MGLVVITDLVYFTSRCTLVYKTKLLTPCWEWQLAVNNKGYGVINARGGGSSFAHKRLWERHNGTVPTGLVLGHVCRNARCINPLHVRPITPKRNSAETDYVRPIQVMCGNGHVMDEENTYIYKKRGLIERACKICRRYNLQVSRWRRRYGGRL